eukprot:COSAG05_NODE_3896_length_1783_cov_45.404988_4_plen_33_part_01
MANLEIDTHLLLLRLLLFLLRHLYAMTLHYFPS